MDTLQIAAFTKIIEIPVFEKELGANVIGAGIHLRLQVVHFQQTIGRGGMTLRKPSYADSETTGVRMA